MLSGDCTRFAPQTYVYGTCEWEYCIVQFEVSGQIARSRGWAVSESEMEYLYLRSCAVVLPDKLLYALFRDMHPPLRAPRSAVAHMYEGAVT